MLRSGLRIRIEKCVGGVVSKVESTRVVLAPKGAGLYCSFAGWIRVMKTLYLRFKDKVKYHSVILATQAEIL